MSQAKKILERKGNTKTFRAYTYVFTWNNYTAASIAELQDYFVSAASYVFQEEKGESGTPHLQGYVGWKSKKSFTVLKKVFPAVHWEKCKNKAAAISYCQKLDSRNGRMWYKGVRVEAVVEDPWDIKKATGWQTRIIARIGQPPVARKIHWYWSDGGAIGKTFLCKHLVLKHQALYVTGKLGDILYGVSKWIEKHGELKILLVGLCRSQGERCSYSALESISDGVFYNSKYESAMCTFNPPFIGVFANAPPDTDKLSADRWIVEKLD